LHTLPTTVELAAKALQMSRIQEKITVVVGPAHDISTAMIPTSPSEKTELNTQTTNHNSAYNTVITMTKCGQMEFPMHWV
jgi:hypothetical protein